MSGRVLLTAGALCAALALLAGCSTGVRTDAGSDGLPSAGSAAPPVGSVEHPRPVSCVEGVTSFDGGVGDARRDPSPPASAPADAPSGTAGGSTGTAPHSPADVTIGPLTWRGLRGLASGDQHAHGVQNSGGWHYLIGPDIAAGAVVTVTVGIEQRARAGLEYGAGFGDAPAPAVTFHSCPATPTSFAGGFFVAGDGRACVPLDVRIGDGAPRRVVISFFKGRCPA